MKPLRLSRRALSLKSRCSFSVALSAFVGGCGGRVSESDSIAIGEASFANLFDGAGALQNSFVVSGALAFSGNPSCGRSECEVTFTSIELVCADVSTGVRIALKQEGPAPVIVGAYGTGGFRRGTLRLRAALANREDSLFVSEAAGITLGELGFRGLWDLRDARANELTLNLLER